MKTEYAILILAGMLGISAFFFPFIHVFEKVLFDQVNIELDFSGYQLAQNALEFFEVLDTDQAPPIISRVSEIWNKTTNIQDKAAFGGIIYFLLGPFFFLFHSVKHVFQGLFYKSYSGGIFYALFFLLAGWLGLPYIGKQYGLELDFIQMAGMGFWMAFGAIILAAVSYFFHKGEK